MEIDNNSFINEYVQVLTTTLDNTLKNSLLLQSKFNVLEKTLNQRAGMDDQIQATVNELTETITRLNSELAEARSEKEFERAERWRIQEAFNKEMREHASLKKEIEIESDRADRLDEENANILDENSKLNRNIEELNVTITQLKSKKKTPPEPPKTRIVNGF